MAKTIDMATLVWKFDGPKKKVPTYRFATRQFYEPPKQPGTHDVQYTNYTRR